jgi:hypothetical protein
MAEHAVDGRSAGDGAEAPEADALLSRLRLIEDQPLDQRSVAFAQIYEGLQSALEGGDSSPRHA